MINKPDFFRSLFERIFMAIKALKYDIIYDTADTE